MKSKAVLIAILIAISGGLALQAHAASRIIRTDAPDSLCNVKAWAASYADPFGSVDGNLDGNQDSATFFAPGSTYIAFSSYITPFNGPAVFCSPSVQPIQYLWVLDGANDPANPASLPDPTTGLPTTTDPGNVAVAAEMYYWPTYDVGNSTCQGIDDSSTSDCNLPVFEVIVWTLGSGNYEVEFDDWPCDPDANPSQTGEGYVVAGTVVPSFSWEGTTYEYTDTCANFDGSDPNIDQNQSLLLDQSGVVTSYVTYNSQSSNVSDYTVEPFLPNGWTADFATTTTLSVSPQVAVPGTEVTLQAIVQGPSDNVPAPPSAGTVNFYDGSTLLQGGVALTWNNGQGVATYSSSNFQAGTHSLTATFSGITSPASNPANAPNNSFISNFQPSTSTASSLTLGPAPTLTISATPSAITVGQSSTIAWSSANTSSCSATGDWSGPQSGSGSTVVSPSTAGTYSYTLTCQGPGGTVNGSATVTVTVPPAPTVFVSVSPGSITLGQSATVTWSSTDATGCEADSAWSGSQQTSGTLSVTPTSAGGFAYSLTCTGAGGIGSGATALIVNPKQPPPSSAPTVTVSISPNSITVGQSATLTWSSTNATSCTADSAWAGTQAASGSQSVTPTSAGGYAYSLTCTGAGGTANGAAALVVAAAPPPASDAPTIKLSISPSTITVGESATLTWSSTNATSCVADSAWSGAEATSGTQTVTPTDAGGYAYSLSCTGAAGTANSAVGLSVVAASPQTSTSSSSKGGGGAIDTWEILGLLGLLSLRSGRIYVSRAARARRENLAR